jgi:hypothetical protein
MQFCPFSCHLISLRSKYPPQHPVFKNHSLCSSLNVRDQVSHPYRTIPRVEAGKNTFTVIPANCKRRRKGNPVVSGETVPADLRED